MNWPAPGKLNLLLRIIGKREDGYHLLQSIFQFITLSDLLDFQLTNDAMIRRLSDLQGIPAEQDLVIRAAKTLQKKTACSQGVHIRIHKHLPIGGGLGGGSSDAATTLIALNHLWQLNLSTDELTKIGLTLGADLPIFMHGAAAWAEGIGEQLTPIDIKEATYLVIYPDCHVSTHKVFSSLDLTPYSSPIKICPDLAYRGHNDCESTVKNMYPAVAHALEWLKQHTSAQLTGTGGCVFARFKEQEEAHYVCSLLPGNWQGWVVDGQNRSALLERLETEKQEKHLP